MRLIKATCEANIVKTEDGLTIPEIIILSNGKGKSDGFAICEENKWFYITSIIDILNLLELTMKDVNQITASVANSQCPQAPSGILPLQTTISADMQPIIDEFNELKEKLK
jgi:hypothetical protein